jgi:hypothetical protein
LQPLGVDLEDRRDAVSFSRYSPMQLAGDVRGLRTIAAMAAQARRVVRGVPSFGGIRPFGSVYALRARTVRRQAPDRTQIAPLPTTHRPAGAGLQEVVSKHRARNRRRGTLQ